LKFGSLSLFECIEVERFLKDGGRSSVLLTMRVLDFKKRKEDEAIRRGKNTNLD